MIMDGATKITITTITDGEETTTDGEIIMAVITEVMVGDRTLVTIIKILGLEVYGEILFKALIGF